eukprot:scaffold1954_cov268-Pinguiococcus_pyrenoidosus.AAC.134
MVRFARQQAEYHQVLTSGCRQMKEIKGVQDKHSLIQENVEEVSRRAATLLQEQVKRLRVISQAVQCRLTLSNEGEGFAARLPSATL